MLQSNLFHKRRDKIQARMVELLSQAALGTKSPDSSLQVDESYLCAAPGKIVDAASLHRILQVPAEHHVFYGPSTNLSNSKALSSSQLSSLTFLI